MADKSLIDPSGQIIQFKDKMHRATYEQLSELIEDRNAKVSKANAVHGDKEALYDNILENSDDPAIVKAREQRDEAMETLAKLVGPQVESTLATAKETVEQVESEVKEIDSTLKVGLSYFRKLYGDDAAKQLPEQVKVRGLKVGGGSGSGGKRIRGYNVIVTFKGKTEEHENFTNAAKQLGEDTSRLQAAFFEAAGVDTAKDAPDTVEFDVTLTEVDDNENKVEVNAHVKAYRVAAEETATPTPPSE